MTIRVPFRSARLPRRGPRTHDAHLKATLMYRKTGNLRAVKWLPAHQPPGRVCLLFGILAVEPRDLERHGNLGAERPRPASAMPCRRLP